MSFSLATKPKKVSLSPILMLAMRVRSCELSWREQEPGLVPPNRQGFNRAHQGDSVLRVGIGVSAIHALGDGRWRPGMSGSDEARGADLWEVFSVVPDHRRAGGKGHPPSGLFLIAVGGVLGGGAG